MRYRLKSTTLRFRLVITPHTNHHYQNMHWYLDSGALHHDNDYFNNIQQHTTSKGMYQCYIGNGQGLSFFSHDSNIINSLHHLVQVNNILHTL